MMARLVSEPLPVSAATPTPLQEICFLLAETAANRSPWVLHAVLAAVVGWAAELASPQATATVALQLLALVSAQGAPQGKAPGRDPQQRGLGWDDWAAGCLAAARLRAGLQVRARLGCFSSYSSGLCDSAATLRYLPRLRRFQASGLPCY